MRTECIRTIEELALSDPRIVVVASDPSSDFMPELSQKHPDRLMIEGVCEQALIGMSAGLASEGLYPFIIMLSVFGTRRCYEQLLLDFGLHKLSGCIVGTGGGLHYAQLGPTHIAVDDILLFSAIPGSAILTPGEPNEAVRLTKQARAFAGLSYMRLSGTTDPLPSMADDIVLGKGRLLAQAQSVLFISCGAATLVIPTAIELLKQAGIPAGAVHLHTIKPLDVDLIRQHSSSATVVLCVEEHRKIGGLTTAVLHALTSAEPPIYPGRISSISVDDTFPSGYGSYEDLMDHYGITGASLADRATQLLHRACS